VPIDEGDRFGFELARITRGGTVIAVMKSFMREFVAENHELGCGL
jgi:hypothetical protein